MALARSFDLALDTELLLGCLLLSSYLRFARAFTGARIGVRALAVNRKSATMTNASIAVDFHQPLDVETDVFPKITFDPSLVCDDLTDLTDIVLVEVFDPLVPIDICLRENPGRPRTADSEDVRQSYFDALVQWKIHSCDTGHKNLRFNYGS